MSAVTQTSQTPPKVEPQTVDTPDTPISTDALIPPITEQPRKRESAETECADCLLCYNSVGQPGDESCCFLCIAACCEGEGIGQCMVACVEGCGECLVGCCEICGR